MNYELNIRAAFSPAAPALPWDSTGTGSRATEPVALHILCATPTARYPAWKNWFVFKYFLFNHLFPHQTTGKNASNGRLFFCKLGVRRRPCLKPDGGGEPGPAGDGLPGPNRLRVHRPEAAGAAGRAREAHGRRSFLVQYPDFPGGLGPQDGNF